MKIGKFILKRFDDKSIWIGKEDGDGAQFWEQEVEKMIEILWEKDFGEI